MSAARLRFVFFFNDTATTEIYTLSLHDALPIYGSSRQIGPAPVYTCRPAPNARRVQGGQRRPMCRGLALDSTRRAHAALRCRSRGHGGSDIVYRRKLGAAFAHPTF